MGKFNFKCDKNKWCSSNDFFKVTLKAFSLTIKISLPPFFWPTRRQWSRAQEGMVINQPIWPTQSKQKYEASAKKKKKTMNINKKFVIIWKFFPFTYCRKQVGYTKFCFLSESNNRDKKNYYKKCPKYFLIPGEIMLPILFLLLQRKIYCILCILD